MNTKERKLRTGQLQMVNSERTTMGTERQDSTTGKEIVYRYVANHRVKEFQEMGWHWWFVASPHSIAMSACECNQEGREP